MVLIFSLSSFPSILDTTDLLINQSFYFFTFMLSFFFFFLLGGIWVCYGFACYGLAFVKTKRHNEKRVNFILLFLSLEFYVLFVLWVMIFVHCTILLHISRGNSLFLSSYFSFLLLLLLLMGKYWKSFIR